MTAREIILRGLLLPLRLYLQPFAFKDEVAALAPELPRDYSLWRARRKLREPAFRAGLRDLAWQGLVALIWAIGVAVLFAAMGTPVNFGGVAFGVALGVAFGVAFGVASGVASGVALGVAFGVALGVASGVAWGVALGVAFGVAFGVAWGVAFGVAFGVALGVASIATVTHICNWPLEAGITICSRFGSRLDTALAVRLWPLCPVRWDEVILLPLPGLPAYLVSLYRANPALGREALAQVAAHRYQSRAAVQAYAMLAREDAAALRSLPALAAYGRSLDWLTDATRLPEPERMALLRARDISREIAGALESDSAGNRLRRMQTAAGMLDTLRTQPGPLAAALAGWATLVETGVRDAERVQQRDEPIPQVYFNDGRPIRPGSRPDGALPFKGRRWLFRRLEEALGGPSGARTTLLLYGQRRTGKTSALLHLPRRLGSRVVPAFLDLQSAKLGGAKDAVGFLQGFADAVCEEARRHRERSLPLLERNTLLNDPYPGFGRWLDRVEAALDSSFLLLCLDEFETLETAIAAGRVDGRILDMLRNIMQHRQRIAVLLSGSHQLDELPPHWAGALITTTTLQLSFLEEADARELIERPVDGFPAIYTPAAVDRIIALTHCQPYLIQLLCAQLVQRMNEMKRMPPASYVTVDDVDAVVPLALERGDAYFGDLWRNQVESDRARRLLFALAQTRDPGLGFDQLRSTIPDEFELRAALTLLRRREIVTYGETYSMTVPFVREYVQRLLQP